MKDILKTLVFGALFAVPFLTLYVENDYFFPFITGKNFWFRILIDVAFAAWILLALLDAKYRPKWSWVAVSFGALLIIMFFANWFGVHRESSFWSNFERMDGYVSLLHTFLYMLVLGSMLTSVSLWQRLLNTSLIVAFLVALYGLAQYGGLVDGSNRIDSRLGNAAYMAVYMLFHIFISFWLFAETKKKALKIAYALLAALFIFVLIETGTRGTAIGLAVGVLVMSGYIGLFGAQFREFRKYAIGAFIVLLIGVGAFVAGRETPFVQNNQNLARIANISFDDLTIRATIWGLAFEGVKERPILGYGQSNFNYIFNQYYDPSLYRQEQWFDRAHDIFVDWLITGGVLGLLAYLSIFVACGYYLLIHPLIDKKDTSFTVLERGVLLGILAGYFTHNIVVFDNIVSYMFFAIILGLIHARVAEPIKKIAHRKVDDALVTQFAAPVVGVALFATIYFLYMPGMLAAGDIIDAFREPSPEARLEAFKRAVDRNSFGHQEITEQLSQMATNVSRDQAVPKELKDEYVRYAEEQYDRLILEKPGDARVHVFYGSFYRAIGAIDKAAEQMAIARTLSPDKQSIIIQQGFIELSRGANQEAHEYFEHAFLLDERNLEAREYYAASLMYNNEAEAAILLMDSEEAKQRFAKSDFLISAANQAKQYDFMIDLFKVRTESNPTEAQNWATLAFLYFEQDNNDEAIATLQTGKATVPTFGTTADCIIANIEAGKEPAEGCSAQ
ncbi:MAG: O-antigen ligase family protein [Patescibacteria group bacterium]